MHFEARVLGEPSTLPSLSRRWDGCGRSSPPLASCCDRSSPGSSGTPEPNAWASTSGHLAGLGVERGDWIGRAVVFAVAGHHRRSPFNVYSAVLAKLWVALVRAMDTSGHAF